MGGFYAVVVTDMLQLALVILALLILAGFVASHYLAHPAVTLPLLQRLPDTFWQWGTNWPEHLTLTLTFVLAWSIAPEMWQRMSATQNPRMAFRGAIWATLLLCSLFLLVATTGLLSAGLFAHMPTPTGEAVSHSNTLLLKALALQLPHPLLSALVFLGFFTAVTSTMDSTINVSSLTLAHDLYQRFFRPTASSKELVWASRIATLIVVLPAIGIALYFQDILRVLWISADIYASVMFFPMVGLLFLRTPPPRWSGILAMIGGASAVMVNSLFQFGVLSPEIARMVFWPVWPYSSLVGLGLSGLGFALGYLLPEKPRQANGGHMDRLELSIPVQ
jgi:SSS family solute:Na+ symporter/sodium/pantothenate symporter